MINLEIEGIDDLVKKLGALQINKALNIGIKKGTIYTQGIAIKETPKDKGLLKNSYETRFTSLSGKLINTRDYGVAVHEGHKQTPGRFVPALGVRLVKSFVKGNPFLTRTAEKSEEKVTDIMNNEIYKQLLTLKN